MLFTLLVVLPKKDAQLTLRLTSDIKTALRDSAVRRRRTLNWLAQDIFERWLARERLRRKRIRKTNPNNRP